MSVFPARAVSLAGRMTAAPGLILSLVVELAAEPAHRPLEEMRGGCADYATDIRAELAAMEHAPRRLKGLAARERLAPITPDQRPVALALLHADGVAHTVMPKRSSGVTAAAGSHSTWIRPPNVSSAIAPFCPANALRVASPMR